MEYSMKNGLSKKEQVALNKAKRLLFKSKVIDDLKENLNMGETARKNKISIQRVHQIAAKHGIDGQYLHKERIKKYCDKVIKDIESGKTFAESVKDLDIDRNTIRSYMKDYVGKTAIDIKPRKLCQVLNKKFNTYYVFGGPKQIKRMPRARYIMEKYLNRKLNGNELVIHKDKNSSNDDINNLQVIAKNEAAKYFLRRNSNG